MCNGASRLLLTYIRISIHRRRLTHVSALTITISISSINSLMIYVYTSYFRWCTFKFKNYSTNKWKALRVFFSNSELIKFAFKKFPRRKKLLTKKDPHSLKNYPLTFPIQSNPTVEKSRIKIHFTHARNTNSSKDRFQLSTLSLHLSSTKVKHIPRVHVALTNKPKIVAGITWAPPGGKPTRCTTGLSSSGPRNGD